MTKPHDLLRQAREAAGYKTAAEFAKAKGLNENTYRSAENGTRGINFRSAQSYAALLGIPWLSLLSPEEGGVPPVPSIKALASHEKYITDRALPVLGMAECGPDGWALWNGDVIDLIPRPTNLQGSPNAYAVYIVGESMEPRYFPGELVHIHPGKPVNIGSFVLVQMKPHGDGEAPRAVVKRLTRRSGNRTTLEQYNPPKRFDLKTDEIVSMHRVVGAAEP